MKNEQDAYGHLMYDYFNNKTGREVIERDDGFITDSSGPSTYFQKFDEWTQHLQEAIKFAKGKVIDIGCGAGRHSLYLQSKGFDVLGIDSSPLALDVCKKRGVKKTKLMSITKINSNLGKFDTILMLGNNFGLFASYKRAQWLLKRFATMTSENGIIIVESLDPYKTEEAEHLSYHKTNRQRKRLGGQLRIRVRYKKYKSSWFDYLLVSKEEMSYLVKTTKWEIKKFIDFEERGYSAIIHKKS